MAGKFQNAFAIIFLSAVNLLITEAVSSKYTSNQNLNLRTAFNSSTSSPKFSSKENLVSANAEVRNPDNVRQSASVRKDNGATENFLNSLLRSIATDSLQAPTKVKKRIKRQASAEKVANELFAWNFNLNVTRLENVSVQDGIKNDSNASVGNEHLGVAVYAESQGPRKTALSEIQKVLGLAGEFIKSVFSSGTENLTNDHKDMNERQIAQSLDEFLGKQSNLETMQNFISGSVENATKQLKEIHENQIVQSLKESSEMSELQTSQNFGISKFGDDGKKNESSIQKGREGRIFFNIFRLGGKILGKITPVPETETTENSIDDSETERKFFSTKESLLDNTFPLRSEIFTENSQQKSSFPFDSLISENEIPAKDLNEENNTENLGLQLVLQQNECSDCLTESFESSVIPTKINEVSKNAVLETHPTEPLLTDEMLRKFCINLLNNLKESPTLSNGEIKGLDSEFNVENEKNLKSSQNPALDILNLHIISEEKTSRTDVAITEESLLTNSDESMTENTVLTDRDSRFFNMFGFGSGRSEIIGDEMDTLFDGQTENSGFENLSFVLGCESFFRRNQNMKLLPKQNRFDISDLKSELLLYFTNATSLSNFQEQQLQLSDLTTLNSSIQTLNKVSGGEKTDSGENKTSLADKNNFINKDLIIKNEETKTESDDFSSNDILRVSESSETDNGVTQTTDGQKDGKFLNFFGFGSGSDDQEERNGSKSRWFFEALGSGARSLDTSDLNESDATNDFRSGDSFQEVADFSGDSKMITISGRDLTEDFNTNTSVLERRFLSLWNGLVGSGDGRELTENAELVATESDSYVHNGCGDDCSHNNTDQSHECDDCDFDTTNTTSVQERRFLSVLLNSFAGSGDGRELTENAELVATESDPYIHNGCGDDCSHNSTDQSHECDDCDFGSLHDPENYNTELAIPVLLNESNCHDDCYPYTEMTDRAEDGNLTSESTSYDNLAEYFQEQSENCNCNFTEGNGTFIECDCNAMQISDAPYASSESLISTDAPPIPKDVITTKLNDENENNCNDCNHENDALHGKRITETINAFETLKQNYQTDTFHSDSRVNDTISHVLESLSVTENPHEEDKTTEMKPRRFVGTIFLTGSGDGGLFGNDRGPINLVEQENTISPVVFPRRRSRLEDSSDNLCKDCVEHSDQSHSFDTQNGQTFSNSTNLTLIETNAPLSSSRPKSEETTFKASIDEAGWPVNVVDESRRGRLDDSSNNQCEDCAEFPALDDLFDSQNNQTSSPFNNSTGLTQVKTNESSTSRPKDEVKFKTSVDETGSIAFSSVTFSNNPSPSWGITITPTEFQPRPCTGARECNTTLNERCITINSSSICDCGRTHVRHKETGKCVVKRHVETSLKLPAEVFDANLKNPESPRYKHMTEKSVETIWLLLNETPEIMRIVADVNVANFTSGSLVIRLNIVLAVEKESEVKSIEGMADVLQRALGDENMMKKASLNISNASVLSFTSELDPCKSMELNYCSKNAHCLWSGANPAGFICYCKDHYRDVSSDPLYPGEKCIEKCPLAYCGPNGHCEILENKKHCLCNGLYFGERCEYPGMIIIASLSVAALISIAVLCVVILGIRCRQTSYGRTPTFRRSEEIGPHVIADGRVSDAVALGEWKGAKASKFSHISTPLRAPPIIKVTHPTLNESSISFDCDSTFDVSPTPQIESTEISVTPTTAQIESTKNGTSTV